jgi:hypothetical protein
MWAEVHPLGLGQFQVVPQLPAESKVEEGSLMLNPDRIDEILNLKKYRRTLMDLKILWWELQRLLEAR